LESALCKLMNQIETDLSAQQRAADRYKSIGLLCVGGVAPGKV